MLVMLHYCVTILRVPVKLVHSFSFIYFKNIVSTMCIPYIRAIGSYLNTGVAEQCLMNSVPATDSVQNYYSDCFDSEILRKW